MRFRVRLPVVPLKFKKGSPVGIRIRNILLQETTNMSYFDTGEKPKIAMVNKSTVNFGDFNALVNALRKFNDQYFAPVWGTPADIIVSTSIPTGYWGMVFLDNADAANALGYHDLTPDGLPLGKIFVKTTLADNAKVSVTASHELVEMLVDPGINLCAIKNTTGVIYALEVADPVEETDFLVDGISMTNFVYPSWFEGFRKPGSAKFDYLGLVDRPYKLLKGGYMSVIKKSGSWSQIFGSIEREKAFKAQDRSGKRNVRRSRFSSEHKDSSLKSKITKWFS